MNTLSNTGPVPLKLLLVEDHDDRAGTFKRWARSPQTVPNARAFTFVRARSAGAAIGLLRRDGGQIYGGILLDHDLTEQRMTEQDELYNGKDVVNAIIEYVDNNVPILVHSSNNEGAKMAETLTSAGFAVERIRYGDLRYRQYVDWLKYVWEVSQP